MEQVIRTLEEFEAAATHFVGSLMPGERATLVTLSGELGAGKTAFTKAVAWALGVNEVVTSPTFVIEKVYLLGGETPKFKRLVHIDAYRLLKGSELAALGFDELMKDPSSLVMLEWPEKVADALPAPAAAISIVVQSDDTRTISYA